MKGGYREGQGLQKEKLLGRQAQWMKPPLTPALSPRRGEGVFGFEGFN